MSKTVAYVGPFAFPSNGANSMRVAGLASAINAAGWGVIIGSGVNNGTPENKKVLNSSDIKMDYINESPDQKCSKIVRVLRTLAMGNRTVEWLDQLTQKPDAIIAYGAHLGYLLRLLQWCRKTNTPLIVDMVEWYQRSHVSGGALGPLALSYEISTRYFVKKAKNVIAISSFLEQYYQYNNLTLRIPPVFDVKTITTQIITRSTKPLILAYVGDPGKKDLLNNVIEAVMQIDQSGKSICFHIAGPSEKDVLHMPALQTRKLKYLPAAIVVSGRVQHEEAMNIVRNAHFTVLLRPPLRYAQAGFPTKVPESLSLGTPVICNITSDLADYIHDGVEGLICKNHSTSACMDVLKQAMSLSIEDLNNMRKSARACAEKYFDYRNYILNISKFMDKLMTPCN